MPGSQIPLNGCEVAIDIARSHSLSSADPHVFTMDTNLVVALDQRLILKAFPPMFGINLNRSGRRWRDFMAG